MNVVLDAVGLFFDAVLVWLRVLVTPTTSRAELVFSPFIVLAFAFHVRNSIVMFRLWRSLRAQGQDEELRASALERLFRALRGMLRLLCWMGIVWALATNWEYTLAAFTFGILAYGIIEAVDGALDWVYQYQRARYWERRDAMEDYAEQVAQRAEIAAQRAEVVAVASARQGKVLQDILEAALASLGENNALAKHAGMQAEAAYHEANSVNLKIADLGQRQVDMTERLEHDRVEDQVEVKHIRDTTDVTKVVAEETHAIVSRDGDGVKGDAHDPTSK